MTPGEMLIVEYIVAWLLICMGALYAVMGSGLVSHSWSWRDFLIGFICLAGGVGAVILGVALLMT